MGWWENIYSSPVVWAAIVAAVTGLLTSRFINSSTQKQIEGFKEISAKNLAEHNDQLEQKMLALKSTFDRQLEDHRSQLKFLNDKLSLVFSKRLEVVREFHKLLQSFSSAFRNYNLELKGNHQALIADLLGPDMFKKSTTDSWQKITAERFHSLLDFYHENKLFFQPELCNLIEKLIFFSITNLTLVGLKKIQNGLNDTNKNNNFSDSPTETGDLEKYLEEVNSTIRLIENEFRYLLGIL